MSAQKLIESLQADAPQKALVSDDAALMLIKMQERWQRTVDSLQLVVDRDDANIQLGEAGRVLEAGSDLHKGFRIGIRVALSSLGEFPIKFLEDNDG